MHSFYVYYKIEQTDAAAAHAAVMRLFLEVQTNANIAGRLLKRADDARTWMEVYEGIADPERFKSELEAALLRSRLLAHIEHGQRHIEHFQSAGAP